MKKGIDEIINLNKVYFGFRNRKCLKRSLSLDIKGVPYLLSKDDYKIVAKVIPIDKNSSDNNSDIEIKYLEFFNKNLKNFPNIPRLLTYYLGVDNKNKPISSVLSKFNDSMRQLFQPQSNVMFCEYYDQGDIDNWSFISRRNILEWKSIIIQVMTTLVVLQDRYSFMHNDLHPGNVLITYTCSNFLEYPHRNINIYNPTRVLVKLWDFEFANIHVPDLENPVKFNMGYNKEYDSKTFLIGLLDVPELPRTVHAWIKSLENFYPEKIIYNCFFEDLVIIA